MAGEVQWSVGFLICLNSGFVRSLRWLNRERPNIPFLI